jgi:hypothetical protein
MRYREFILIFFLTPLFTGTRAQEIMVRALMDSNKALIGDQLTLHLMVEKPSVGFDVDFPLFRDSITKDIEIIKVSPVDTAVIAGEKLQLSQNLVITVFDTGFFEIPALPFSVTSSNITDTINTLPVGFEILSVEADSTIKDIKAIYKVPLSFREIWPYIAILVVLILLGWLLIYYVRNRKTSILHKAMAISTEPPDVIALHDLEQLKAEKAWMNNKIKYHYSKLSEILRVYIEGRFRTQALEQTTEEILLSLKQVLSDANEYKRLSSMLRLADFVKFAKVIPEADESASQVDEAIEFVHRTSVPVNVQESEIVMVQSNRTT